MRVLIATVAERTNFLCIVPLAWSLRTAGHEVRVASQPALTNIVTEAGLTSVPVGKDHSFWRVMRARATFDPLTERVPPFDMAGLPLEQFSWERLRSGYRKIVPWWWRMVNEPMLGELTTFCLSWRPDLVIWEPTTFSGAIAAKVSGAVHARYLWGVDAFGRTRCQYLRLMNERPAEDREDALASWLEICAGRFGESFSEDLASGQFTIDSLPSAIRLDGTDVRYVSMRYVPYNGRAIVPRWLRERPGRPRICLTLGISATERQGGYVVSVQEALDSLADLDAEIVVTLPRQEQERLRHVPANARLVSYVPLHALIPTCSAVINHGGAGTALTTLFYGVPQLIIPRPTFDEPLLARQLTDAGGAISLPSDEATGSSLRRRTEELLTDGGLRRRTHRLLQEMLALPTPNEVVPTLEALTGRSR